MKLLKKSFLLLAILMSLNAGAETCTLTLQEFTPRSNCREVVKKYVPFESADWESCFIKAVNLAYQVGYQRAPLQKLQERRQCQAPKGTGTPLQLVQWSFDDSFFPLMDSHGIVNNQTLDHVFKPETGTQVFDEDGGELF